MKSIVMPKNEQLHDELNEQLINDVKKNLSKEDNEVSNPKTKFTAVDMWNRHRQSRSTRTMMRPWEMN